MCASLSQLRLEIGGDVVDGRVLAPLENEYSPRDPRTRFRDRQNVNELVLHALRNCRDVADQKHRRFDCKALEGWNVETIGRELEPHLPRDRHEYELQNLALRKAVLLLKKCGTDLAFYGLVKKGMREDEFEVKLNVLDRDLGFEPLFQEWIEIYGRLDQLEHGLIKILMEKITIVIQFQKLLTQ